MKRILNRLVVTNTEGESTETTKTAEPADESDGSAAVEWEDVSRRTAGPVGTEERLDHPPTADRLTEDADGSAEAVDKSAVGADSDQLLAGLLDSISEPTLLVGQDGKISHLNRAAREAFDTTDAEAVGTRPAELHGGQRLADRVVETGEAIIDRRETADIAGQSQPISRTVTPIIDESAVVAAIESISIEQPAADQHATQSGLDDQQPATTTTEQPLDQQKADHMAAYQQTVIDDLEAKIVRLAEGDLTIEPTVPEPPAQFDELQTIHEEFSDLNAHLTTAVENYRAVLSRLTLLADDLDDTSHELSANSEEVTASIEEISHSTEQMADGSEELAEQTDEADLAAANLTATVEEITASVQEIDAETSAASKLALDGVREGTDAVDQIRSATDATSEITDEVRRLERRMEAVGETLDVISSIADQTNLLALNASIEAARAGQEGDGFAVVADEVKKLAEESKQSADEIESIITDAQDQTAEVATQITHTNEEVSEGADAVERVVDQLDEIEAAVEGVSSATAEVSDAVENQAENMDSFGATIDSAAAMSEELSASVQEISAGLEQQSTATDQVAHRATDLSATSEELYDRIDQFRLAKDETADVDDIEG